MTTEVRDGRAEVEIAMVPASERSMSTSEIADQIRKNVQGLVPGGDIRVSAQSGLWMLRRLFGSGGADRGGSTASMAITLDQAKTDLRQDQALYGRDSGDQRGSH
ncbi:MAG: hypothetical protein U5K69_27390 [Balneolaceae bacterium]|nr:hypothetical protein [Balneolaceae bacterium]